MVISPNGSTLLGDETVHRGVRSTETTLNEVPWLRGTKACPFLEVFGIRHLGVVRAVSPYRFERRKLEVTMLLACLSGSGRIQVNGRGAILGEGMATVMQAGDTCSYHACDGEPWELVWICLNRNALLSVPSSSAPKTFAVAPMHHAVECLIVEWQTAADPITIQMIIGLIERMANRFGIPKPECNRFYLAWSEVENDLAKDWTLEAISHLAACSVEQFRRVCLKEFATSPKRHLTDLRLSHARRRLLTSRATVETIAMEVGYGDAGAFSNVFKRRTGYLPTELRRLRAVG